MSYSTGAELSDYLATQIAIGHYDLDWLVEEAAQMFELDESSVRPIVEELSTASERDAATWPEITDCDRLDAAFAALCRDHVDARQHFTCCTTCGHREMHEDIHAARERGRRVDGYVYYHRQDAEHVVCTGSLCLRFATLANEPSANAALAPRIVAALEQAGLSPSWSGEPSAPIVLPGFRWQRRSWPEDHDDTHGEEPGDPQQALARWLELIERTTPSSFGEEAGDAYGKGLVDAGLVETAIAWARAHGTSVLVGRHRASALVTVAARLPAEHSVRPELWREALACAPYGADGTLIEVLQAIDMGDFELRRLARIRALEARRNIWGAAAVAWYLAKSGDHDTHLLELVTRRSVEPDDTFGSDSARAALQAALWVVHHRRGEVEEAESFRDLAFEALESTGAMFEFVARDAIRTARVLIGAAVSAEAERSPNAAAAIEAAEARRAVVAEQFEEGLRASYELERAHEDLFVAHVDAGGEIALRALTERGRALRESFVSACEVQHELERVRAGEPLRWLVRSPKAPTPSSLKRHLGKWAAASGAGAEPPTSSGAAILRAAAAFATAGDRARARELVELVLPPGGRVTVPEHSAVIALLSVGELDRALEIARESRAPWAIVGPIAVRLVEVSRTPDASSLLRRAFLFAANLSRTIAIAPAVLAVASDRRAAATAMLEAWARANRSLDCLVVPSA